MNMEHFKALLWSKIYEQKVLVLNWMSVGIVMDEENKNINSFLRAKKIGLE